MNRTNTVIIVIAAAVLLAVGNAQTKPAGPTQAAPIPCSGTGRYQLFTGEHLVFSDGIATMQKAIMRIDTETGQAYYWVDSQKDGKLLTFWHPIDQQ